MSEKNTQSAINLEFSIPGYEIKRELGRGGMAVVYLAIQESFGRDVAIKVLPLINANDESFTERFLREARIVSRLVHPNIVTVYDVGIHQGHHYLSMEFVPGMDLRRAQAKLSRLDLLNAVKSVASALDFAGKKGYVHRDVKPENIMLHEEDNRVILMDFGIARGNDTQMSMTATGRAIGTPYYMSPEQTKGKDVDHRSDIYSLGVVLYQMLTGHVPYDADSAVAVGIKHITDPIPVLPQNLRMYQTIINTALAKSPEHRYQTAAELIDALNAIPKSALEMLEIEAENFRNTGVDHNASTIASIDNAALKSQNSIQNDSTATPPPIDYSSYQQNAVTQHSTTGLKTPSSHRRRSTFLYLLLVTLIGIGIYKRDAITHLIQTETSRFNTLFTNKNKTLPQNESLPLVTKANPDSIAPAQTDLQINKNAVDANLHKQITILKQNIVQNPKNAVELARLYKQILRKKPNDVTARNGIKELRQWYTDEINTALTSNDLIIARQRMNMLKQSFPRMSRSPKYVSLDKQIKKEEAFVTHLKLAKKYIAFKQLASPADANALSELNAANTIYPGNEDIIKLRNEVADIYFSEASEFLKQGLKQKAQNSINLGLIANPDHEELLLFNNKKQVKKPTKKINQLLLQANAYYIEEQFFSPTSRNAFETYRNVLTLDPANKEAKKGLNKIKNYWLEIFYENLKKGNLDDSSSTLVKIQERFARDPDIKKAQNKLARVLASSRPEISMVHLSTQKLYSLRTPEPSLLEANKPINVGFHYINFIEVTDSLFINLIRLKDNKILIKQEESVSGDKGDKFVILDMDSRFLTRGKYKIEFILGQYKINQKIFTLR